MIFKKRSLLWLVNIIKVAVFLGVGTFILLFSDNYFSISDTLRYVLGIGNILYGFFKMYTTIQQAS